MTVLAKPRIIELHKSGDIQIEPFNLENVKNSSYDVTLGSTFWVESSPNVDMAPDYHPDSANWVGDVGGHSFKGFQNIEKYEYLLNMYSEESVRKMWKGPFTAMPLKVALPGIPLGTPVIVIGPKQNMLGHTHEFIGSTDLVHTTKMQARSSLGRNQITVCRCAGLGDIGYCDRWTIEITNNSDRPTILVPGRRIAQISFFATTGLDDVRDSYPETGKYQTKKLTGKSFAELEADWKPESLLPKMWKDAEAQ